MYPQFGYNNWRRNHNHFRPGHNHHYPPGFGYGYGNPYRKNHHHHGHGHGHDHHFHNENEKFPPAISIENDENNTSEEQSEELTTISPTTM